jgi:hypothetical protein
MLRSNALWINSFSTSAIFCSYQSFLIFFLSQLFFALPLHQVLGSSAGDTSHDVGEVVGEPRSILVLINRFSTSAIFLFVSVISYFFYLSHFFTLLLHQVLGSTVGDSATPSSAPVDSFASVIKDVIHSLEDDPTQKELRVEASEAEERPPAVDLENVPSTVAQQDVSKQPATYVRRPKKQKQLRVCVVITISVIHFHSQSFIENIHIIAYFNRATGDDDLRFGLRTDETRKLRMEKKVQKDVRPPQKKS